MHRTRIALLASGMLWATVSAAPEFPIADGTVLTHADVSRLEPFLPSQFWQHRDTFLPPGLRMEIGPAFRDYGPPPVYRAATEANRGKATLGADGELVGYVAGLPFPDVDCKDPQAGAKLIWNFTWRWQGFGLQGDIRYTYWEKGAKRALEYRGETFGYFLKHRPEPQFAERGGDVFPGERRLVVIGFQVDRPKEAEGTRTLTYRYAKSLEARATAQPEETWIYARDIRRIRKVSQTVRSAAVAGTDFSFDDLFSFSGLPAQYRWRCVEERPLLAPMNTLRKGYPYVEPGAENGQFGPFGFSYATDRWELRDAVMIEMVPKDDQHPYARKEIWLDRQTMSPLYSFAYDRTGALWKIILHNHRWSEDDLPGVPARDWYPSWEGVAAPRDLRVVSESIANVQTGTSSRLDFWDSHGTMPKKGDLRRFIDVQRLRRGR